MASPTAKFSLLKLGTVISEQGHRQDGVCIFKRKVRYWFEIEATRGDT